MISTRIMDNIFSILLSIFVGVYIAKENWLVVLLLSNLLVLKLIVIAHYSRKKND